MHIPKSYRYYKFEDWAAICNIQQQEAKNLLTTVANLAPSDWLSTTLEMNILMQNEKAKSELIVMTVLVERK